MARRPGRCLTQATVVVLLEASAGCGGHPTSPSEGAPAPAFPVVSTSCTSIGSGGTATYSTVYFIWGLSNNVVDGSARSLEAVLHVGEAPRLSLELDGCGYSRNAAWTSSDPGVATLEEPSYGGLGNRLTALAPGATDVWVDFEAPDGKVHRTYPAYCPGSRYVCVPPRTAFVRVRVVAP